MNLLDLFFPKYCVQCRKLGDYLCADCFATVSFDVGTLCLGCNQPAIDGLTHPGCQGRYTIDGTLASIGYRGVVKRLIYQFKYQPYVTDLQHLLGDFFYEGLIQQEVLQHVLQEETYLVPIPLHPTKHRARGYNHAEILAKQLAQRLGLKTKNLLQRTKQTQTQATLKREERLANMKGAFTVANNQEIKVNNRQVILVDDIITSGATMIEAARVLKKAGVKRVWGVALAHG